MATSSGVATTGRRGPMVLRSAALPGAVLGGGGGGVR
jgi:hypothetical protein